MIDMRKSALADAVLAYLRWSASEDKPTITVTPYQNGRESGWVASIFWDGESESIVDRAAVFSESRHSDHIVLYTGRIRDFDINGIPNEDTYKTKRMFKTDGAFAVAAAALAWLYDANPSGGV